VRTPGRTPEANVLRSASGVGALTGTILSAVSTKARAIIADVRGRQRVYARGDEISDVGKLVEIHPDHVVLLRRDGRLEALGLSGNPLARSIQRAPGASQKIPPENNDEALRNAVFTRPELLLELAGATVVVEGGHFLGYRVMKPEDPAFLQSLGLEPGDVLTEVNGVPLERTSDYGAEVFDAMSGTGRLTYTVRRGNQILALTY
jgi:general secretion pathway protein C